MTPSLHVVGESDKHIEKWRSERLELFYNEVSKIVHQGGHMIP